MEIEGIDADARRLAHNQNEEEYLSALAIVLCDGRKKHQRAVLASTGERPQAITLFGEVRMRFDLKTFPLLTTKRVSFRLVALELLWILRGENNVRWLQKNGCRIWDQWADASGNLGACYPGYWRRFYGSDECYATSAVDQIEVLMAGIRDVVDDPNSRHARRLILSSWHPADQNDNGVPTGCHTLSQFHVDESRGTLDCSLYQRSGDMFLGVPFNIASYALLTSMLAHCNGLLPGKLTHAVGDAHVYENHLEAVREQLTRSPLGGPVLLMRKGAEAMRSAILRMSDKPSMDDEFDWFELLEYSSHSPLRGEVAI